MKNRFAIFLVIFLANIPLNSFADNKSGNSVDYYSAPAVSMSDGRYLPVETSISIATEGDRVDVSFRSSSFGGRSCSDKDWRCVRIPFMFNFSVNRKWKTLPAEWEYDSFKYQNIGLEKISIFGREVEVYLICSSGGDEVSKSPTRDACFNYSLKHGVLAMYLYDDGFDGETVTAYYAARGTGLFAR